MSARVLIIEDNPANLELMRYLLEAHGYVTLIAENGQRGLDVVQREQPDLVICDIQMPVMDGFEVLRKLKGSESLRHVPIVAVTAFAMVGDRDKLLAAGFDGYLPKPIAPEAFVKQVEAFLPVAARSRVQLSAMNTTTPAPGRRTAISILVVDDMAVNLELWHSLLGQSGFEVITASGIHEALQQARRVVPDLILSDVCMNDGSGYDLIKEIKRDSRLRSIPFVFITSTAMDEAAREKGLALGAAKFLFRPIEPQILLNEIDTCLMAHQKSASRPVSPAPQAPHTTTGDEIPPPQRNVLLLDDRPENLNLMRMLLERAGFIVRGASHLAQALALISDSLPDLILSDVNMPRDDGFTLLTAIRSDPRLRPVAFAFVSASDWTPAIRDKALQLGADRFFVRPSAPELLVAEVESCLRARGRC